MADIIVGEKVINKKKEKGTIISLDDRGITVDFGSRVAAFMCDAFEKGFLKYENVDLQSKLDDAKKAAEQKAEEQRIAAEKAKEDRRIVQAATSKKHFKVTVVSASIRLEPAPISFDSVRKKDQDLIGKIFTECDDETKALFARIDPVMVYPRYTSHARSKYCVGFLSKHENTYVFRVFSRNDIYKKSVTNAVTVKQSDSTEVLRVIIMKDKVYYFSKNLSLAGGASANTNSFGTWHVTKFNSDMMLNEIVKNCDCGYLNDYISESKQDCLQYLKLLIPAFYNNKVEIAFKNKLFLAAYRIDDIVYYLEQFTSKQVDYACKNNILNTLPIIKHYGYLDSVILRNMEAILRKRSNGVSIYNVLEGHLSQLGIECSDLSKKLIGFLKKIDYFHPATYYDYINELVERPGITIRDFFDKDYINRHDTMLMEKMVRYTKAEEERYISIAKELSWIDREDNGYFIIVPKHISDFKYEGEWQHNCVFTNEYFKMVIARDSIVVFLRKEENTPYVTIEFDYETFEVIQAYGKYNTCIDDELHEYIVELGKQLNCEKRSQ